MTPTAPSEATSYTKIPLEKLTLWDGNARRGGSEDALIGLAANIGCLGLLQPLIVKESGDGFDVVAGGRRLEALRRLQAQGKWDRDVPCYVVAPDASSEEISLAENIVREQMHPADQYEAFKRLIDKGLGIETVAAHFGVAPEVVRRRLRLADLAPEILRAYRDDRLTLEQVQAFATTDDRDRQLTLLGEWESLAAYECTPKAIRWALTDGEIRGADPRARFVGLEAYREGGGRVRQDLFSEGLQGTVLLDERILDKLVLDRLAEAREKIVAEGWKWVEQTPAFTRGDFITRGLKKKTTEKFAYTPEEESELESLIRERDALVAKEETEEGTTEEEDDRLESIESLIEVIMENAEVYGPGVREKAGAIVTISSDTGRLRIVRGLLGKDDHENKSSGQTGKKGEKKTGAATSEEVEKEEPEAKPLSGPLLSELTARRSAAVAAALAESPELSLRAVVWLAISRLIYAERFDKGVDVTFDETVYPQALENSGSSRGLEHLIARLRDLQDRLPPEREGLWDWLKDKEDAVLLRLLALCTASTYDTINHGGKPENSCGDALTDCLTTELAPAAIPYNGVSIEEILPRLSRPQILGLVREAGVPVPKKGLKSMKAPDLAAWAAREIKAVNPGWVPPEMRLPGQGETTA